MSEEVKFGNTGLAEFVVDGNDALKFKLLRSPSDIDDESKCFAPEMCHQIYGDNENVFGYKGLRVELYMAASNLKAYLATSYEDKVDPANTDGVKADDVLEPIGKILAPDSYTFSKEEFLKDLESDAEVGFKPMGEMLNSFTALDDRTFQVYKCSESTPGLREYHEKLQAWIMFFIDAASYIDIDDDNWRIFLLFEKFNSSDGTPRYAVAGYMTVYEYYAYGRDVNKKRPRIAQMLVLPPFQRAGLGSRLLDTVYNDYKGDSTVVDITVEDPSDNFVRLRDFVDTKNCMKLPAFSKDNVLKGFNEEMARSAAADLKICKKQARRIYEVIRLQYTSLSDVEQYKNYRIDVKRRLNIPYQKEQSQLAKLQKALKPEEFAAAMVSITNREQRMESLGKQFTELEAHYKQVLEKVAAA